VLGITRKPCDGTIKIIGRELLEKTSSASRGSIFVNRREYEQVTQAGTIA
jgi:hypothetical protein